MPALTTIPLSTTAVALGTTADAAIATAGSNLTAGRRYWIFGNGRAGGATASGQANAAITVGGVALRRLENQSFPNNPSPALQSPANGSSHQLSFSLLHTPVSSAALAMTAWMVAGAGEAAIEAVAVDVTDLVDEVDIWDSGFANSDTVDVTPAAAAGWTTVDSLDVNAAAARDFLVAASAEIVGAAASGNEMRVRVLLNGVLVPESLVEHDSGARASSVAGYLYLHPLPLLLGSNTIAIQVEGIEGNVGARRQNIIAIDSDVFDAPIVTGSAPGATAAGTSDVEPAGVSVAYGDGTIDWVLGVQAQKQATFWGDSRFLVGLDGGDAGDRVDTPSTGFGAGISTDLGGGAADDMVREVGFSYQSAPAASVAQYEISKYGGGGGNTYGEDTARGAGPIRIVAIPMSATGSGPGTSTATADGTPSSSTSVSEPVATPGGVVATADGAPSSSAEAFDATAQPGGQVATADGAPSSSTSVPDASATPGGVLATADGTPASSCTAFDAVILGQLIATADGTPSSSTSASDALAIGLSDNFESGPADMAARGFDVYKPAALATNEVVDGRARMQIVTGGGGPNASNWYQGNDGALNSKPITGPIAVRARVYVWGADLASLPRLQSGRYGIVGVAAHDPDRTLYNYVHAGAGSFNGFYAMETKTTTNSVSVFPTTAITPGGGGSPSTPWIIDVELIREEDGRTFRSRYRNAPAVDLESDVGWLDHETNDRPDLPATLDWGFMVYEATADFDIAAEFDEIQYRAVGTQVATGDGAARSSALANDATATPGGVVVVADGTVASTTSTGEATATAGAATATADGVPSSSTAVSDATVAIDQVATVDGTPASSCTAFDAAALLATTSIAGTMTATITASQAWTVEIS